MRRVRARVRVESLLAAAVVLLFVSAYMIVGMLTVDPASRHVPLLTGSVTAALLVAEILKQFLTGSAREDGKASSHVSPAAGLRAEATVLLSVIGAVTGIYLVGFMIAIPIYLVAAITVIGGRSVCVAATTSIVTAIAIYVTFEMLLSYRLFPGVLFS